MAMGKRAVKLYWINHKFLPQLTAQTFRIPIVFRHSSSWKRKYSRHHHHSLFLSIYISQLKWKLWCALTFSFCRAPKNILVFSHAIEAVPVFPPAQKAKTFQFLPVSPKKHSNLRVCVCTNPCIFTWFSICLQFHIILRTECMYPSVCML